MNYPIFLTGKHMFTAVMTDLIDFLSNTNYGLHACWPVFVSNIEIFRVIIPAYGETDFFVPLHP
jgi:hypothetical protein